jgi:hypothetical protein
MGWQLFELDDPYNDAFYGVLLTWHRQLALWANADDPASEPFACMLPRVTLFGRN